MNKQEFNKIREMMRERGAAWERCKINGRDRIATTLRLVNGQTIRLFGEGQPFPPEPQDSGAHYLSSPWRQLSVIDAEKAEQEILWAERNNLIAMDSDALAGLTLDRSVEEIESDVHRLMGEGEEIEAVVRRLMGEGDHGWHPHWERQADGSWRLRRVRNGEEVRVESPAEAEDVIRGWLGESLTCSPEISQCSTGEQDPVGGDGTPPAKEPCAGLYTLEEYVAGLLKFTQIAGISYTNGLAKSEWVRVDRLNTEEYPNPIWMKVDPEFDLISGTLDRVRIFFDSEPLYGLTQEIDLVSGHQPSRDEFPEWLGVQLAEPLARYKAAILLTRSFD